MTTEGTPTERLDWLRAVVRNCGDSAIRVATELESRWNRSTGTCWPSVATLAKDSLVSERSVQRALAELERAGFIGREFPDAQGRGQATTYFLEWSAGQRGMGTAVSPLTAERVTPVAPISPERVTAVSPKGDSRVAERVSPVAPQLREENSEKRTLSNATRPADENELEDPFKNLPLAKASKPAPVVVCFADWKATHPDICVAGVGKNGSQDDWLALWGTYEDPQDRTQGGQAWLIFSDMYKALAPKADAKWGVGYRDASQWMERKSR